MARGCLCFNCARLGECFRANCKVEHCDLYLSSRITSIDAARFLGCSSETFYQLKKYEDGLKYIVRKFQEKGITVCLEECEHEVVLYRKEHFKSVGGYTL